MLAAMRTQQWIILLALVAATGCDKNADPIPAIPAPAASTVESAVARPKREPAQDTEAKPLLEQFKCPSKTSKDACEVLDGFASGTGWDLTAIHAEEARYFGKALSYSDGEAQEKWVFLIVKKVALNVVAEGDLPIRVILRELDKTLGAENTHAEMLWTQLKRDNPVTKRNSTANYVMAYAPANWDSAAATQGASTILHISDGAFVRQSRNRSLHLVQMDTMRPGATGFSGALITLYPLSW